MKKALVVAPLPIDRVRITSKEPLNSERLLRLVRIAKNPGFEPIKVQKLSEAAVAKHEAIGELYTYQALGDGIECLANTAAGIDTVDAVIIKGEFREPSPA